MKQYKFLVFCLIATIFSPGAPFNSFLLEDSAVEISELPVVPQQTQKITLGVFSENIRETLDAVKLKIDNAGIVDLKDSNVYPDELEALCKEYRRSDHEGRIAMNIEVCCCTLLDQSKNVLLQSYLDKCHTHSPDEKTLLQDLIKTEAKVRTLFNYIQLKSYKNDSEIYRLASANDAKDALIQLQNEKTQVAMKVRHTKCYIKFISASFGALTGLTTGVAVAKASEFNTETETTYFVLCCVLLGYSTIGALLEYIVYLRYATKAINTSDLGPFQRLHFIKQIDATRAETANQARQECKKYDDIETGIRGGIILEITPLGDL